MTYKMHYVECMQPIQPSFISNDWATYVSHLESENSLLRKQLEDLSHHSKIGWSAYAQYKALFLEQCQKNDNLTQQLTERQHSVYAVRQEFGRCLSEKASIELKNETLQKQLQETIISRNSFKQQLDMIAEQKRSRLSYLLEEAEIRSDFFDTSTDATDHKSPAAEPKLKRSRK